MRELLLVSAIIGSGLFAAHAMQKYVLASFWRGANGVPLNVSVGEIAPAPVSFADEWKNNPK